MRGAEPCSGCLQMVAITKKNGVPCYQFEKDDLGTIVIDTSIICQYFGLPPRRSIYVHVDKFRDLLEEFSRCVNSDTFEQMTDELIYRVTWDENFNDLCLLSGFYYITTPLPFYMLDDNMNRHLCTFAGLLR